MTIYSDGLSKLRENLEWFLQSGVDTSIIGKTKEPVSIEKPRGIVARPEKIYVPEDNDVDENTIGQQLKERALDNWGKIFAESQAAAISSASTKKEPEVVIVDETMDNSKERSVDVSKNLNPDTSLVDAYLRKTDPKKQGSVKRSLDAIAKRELEADYLASDLPRTGSTADIAREKFEKGMSELSKMKQLKTVTDKDHETNITFEELESIYSGSPFNVIPKEETVKAKEDYLKYKKANRKRADYLNKDGEEIQGTSSEWLIGLKNIITEGEADNYNTISNLHKNPPPTDLTNMTVAEVKVWMEQERGNDAESTASGQYQINYTNLNYLLNKGTLRPNELFNEDTQDKAYKQLLNKRKFNRYENVMKQGSEIQDPSGVEELSDKKIEAAMEMQLRLAKEWASIPIPYDLTKAQRGSSKYPNGLKKGQSYYEQAGLNAIPASNQNVDFLNYLLSYTEIQENN